MGSMAYGRRHREGLPQPERIGGFTYLAMLVVIAIMSITLAATGEVWYIALKREKEQELLFAGNQFRRAIRSYYAHTPALGSPQLMRLEDLLLDPRYPSTQRYLRKIYADPISNSAGWGLIKGPSGEILGVHSLSEDEPMKKANFSLVNKHFEGKTKYVDWVFMQSSGMQLTTQDFEIPQQEPVVLQQEP